MSKTHIGGIAAVLEPSTAGSTTTTFIGFLVCATLRTDGNGRSRRQLDKRGPRGAWW